MRRLVGIPTLNGPDRLERCLASLFNQREERDRVDAVKRLNVRVLVADDGSGIGHLEDNRHLCKEFGVELLEAGKRLGIAAEWNRLVRHHEAADTIVLLNDDVELVPDALDVLFYSVEENVDLATVSLRAELDAIKSERPERPIVDYNEARIFTGGGDPLLSSGGACFAFRREVFDKLGGFDEENFFVYNEEVDFGVRARKAGLLCGIAEYPIIYHAGSATLSSDEYTSPHGCAVDLLIRAQKNFLKKWGKTPDALRKELNDPYKNPSGTKDWVVRAVLDFRTWASHMRYLNE